MGVNKAWFFTKKAASNPIDMWWFIQGVTRWFLYKKAPFLIRQHIKEQFEYRMGAAIKCTLNKSCVVCACSTPSLYFANKACSATNLTIRNRKLLIGSVDACYNHMLNKSQWETLKQSWKS